MTKQVRVFKALGDENRLRIVAALQGGERCVCDLGRCLGMAQPTVSHHLKILREAGLVIGEKDGSLIRCSLNGETFARYGLDVEIVVANVVE